MGFFDFFRSASPRPSPGRPTAAAAAPARPEAEPIFAVPVAARKLRAEDPNAKEKYVFYGFLFADSAEAAVARLRRELRDENLEFIGLTGKVLTTSVADWPEFVAHRFDWLKDDLPTARQLADASRGIVYYTPKITQL